MGTSSLVAGALTSLTELRSALLTRDASVVRPGDYFPYHNEFYAVAKQMRPELHVLMTDGCCWSASQRDKSKVQELVDGPDICPEPFANGTCGWPTNDFMCDSPAAFSAPLV
eukprot:SAG31_NODE_2165_length_6281_cov_2.028308_1_plen_112_part_00